MQLTPRPFDLTVCAEHARMQVTRMPWYPVAYETATWYQAASSSIPYSSAILCGDSPVPSVWNGALCAAPSPSDTYSLRQKIRFAKGVWANSPLCSLAAKKLSKVLCSFDTHFLFKYDLFVEYILGETNPLSLACARQLSQRESHWRAGFGSTDRAGSSCRKAAGFAVQAGSCCQ